MKAGVSFLFANHDDWGRFEAQERGEDVPGRSAKPDDQVWREELALGALVEPLGFDSLWTVEHHTTPYTMQPNPLQLLAYFAGATTRIDFGTMVLVLPWHNPLRVAEDLTALQNMIGPDRRIYAGVGRGAARREFGSLQIPMGESRQRWVESVEIIRKAITEDRFTYDGKIFQLPETSLRPAPVSTQVADDMHAAWGNPQTIPYAAELGLKPIIIPKKTWDEYAVELAEYGALRAQHGFEPVQPIIAVSCYVHTDGEAGDKRAYQHFLEYGESSLKHYELGGSHFADIPGYEAYRDNAAMYRDGAGKWADVFVKNNVWGSPEQVVAGIEEIRQKVNPSQFVFLLRFGSMSAADGERNMRLFAEKVLPAVHAMPAGEPVAAAS
ncbi:LLM class flavin-dependent oxidoreductase [Pseudonocardia sp. NPDC049154]|uniref:LLM class flavin-dependent oxidoreductase n=1 Tax=Pseudonocardia sp. NPDC049154 TaxID=3155501 RepID=UPI0033D51AFA